MDYLSGLMPLFTAGIFFIGFLALLLAGFSSLLDAKIKGLRVELKADIAKLDFNQSKMEKDIAKLEKGQSKLEKGQSKLEKDIAKLEEGQSKLSAKLDQLLAK